MAREDFVCAHRLRVRWAEVDMQKIVFNGHYLTYIDTAIADYFDHHSGFVVESHPEPAAWPQDPDGRCTTTWHRLVWPSLRDAIRESYEVARSQRPRYDALAANARAVMTARAGTEAVWARLAPALDSVAHAL